MSESRREPILCTSTTSLAIVTAVVEAEAVINSRPLTYVSSDDLGEPLTPAHLLTGRRLLSLPDYISHGCEDIDDVEHELLDRRHSMLH